MKEKKIMVEEKKKETTKEEEKTMEEKKKETTKKKEEEKMKEEDRHKVVGGWLGRFWNLRERVELLKKNLNLNSSQGLVQVKWFGFIPNGQNNLIHNCCIYGCWFTQAVSK